jgi:hypothetical protein
MHWSATPTLLYFLKWVNSLLEYQPSILDSHGQSIARKKEALHKYTKALVSYYLYDTASGFYAQREDSIFIPCL